MKIIAHVYTDFKEKFGIPRQSGIVKSLRGRIVFEKEYKVCEAFRGLEDYSHLWILWKFSKAEREVWSPTVRPPLLGGNKRIGVFATRSPYRPNPVGMSCVEIDKIEYEEFNGPVIYIKGADILDNTPVYDIKPYLPYADSYPCAKAGFTEALSERQIEVCIKDDSFYKLSRSLQIELEEILKNDPRPSYHNDERIYGMKYNEYEIKFSVVNNVLNLVSVNKINYGG